MTIILSCVDMCVCVACGCARSSFIEYGQTHPGTSSRMRMVSVLEYDMRPGLVDTNRMCTARMRRKNLWFSPKRLKPPLLSSPNSWLSLSSSQWSWHLTSAEANIWTVTSGTNGTLKNRVAFRVGMRTEYQKVTTATHINAHPALDGLGWEGGHKWGPVVTVAVTVEPTVSGNCEQPFLKVGPHDSFIHSVFMRKVEMGELWQQQFNMDGWFLP